jgi:hypothetical protein
VERNDPSFRKVRLPKAPDWLLLIHRPTKASARESAEDAGAPVEESHEVTMAPTKRTKRQARSLFNGKPFLIWSYRAFMNPRMSRFSRRRKESPVRLVETA